jgi:hypothetical protein
MEAESSLLSSQQTNTGLYSGPEDSIPQHNTMVL